MRGGRARWLLAAALALAGCATAASGDDAARMARGIAARAREADVVYLGESHDNPHHHRAQQAILEAMLTAGARPALGFEMLGQDQQALVDRAMAAGGDTAAIAAQWTERRWPDFGMYRPLFDLARRYGLPVLALDLDQPVVRRISAQGLGALSADQQRPLTSRLAPDAERERSIGREIESAHCGLLPSAAVPRMVEAWHARNITMARRIVDALAARPQIVVIVGRGHQAPGGLPAQVAALRPGTRQLAVDLVETGADDSDSAPGDHVVWAMPPVERQDPCAPLRR